MGRARNAFHRTQTRQSLFTSRFRYSGLGRATLTLRAIASANQVKV